MASDAPQQNPRISREVVKVGTAVTVSGSFLILSGLILAGTVIGLVVATPVLVIFSPIVLPSAITVFLILLGFVTSGGFGVAALTALVWMYKHVTGKTPPGGDQLEDIRMRLVTKARGIKDPAEAERQQQQLDFKAVIEE